MRCDPGELNMMDLITCPKCKFAHFSVIDRDGEWKNESGKVKEELFYTYSPDGEIRVEEDFLIFECPICQAKIRVEISIPAPLLFISLEDDENEYEYGDL